MKRTTIYSRFHQQVEKYPEATAVATDNEYITYSSLDRRVDAILEKIGRDDANPIGIVMTHGIDMIAAMLAVLKSGAAYVPAEPTLPKARIDYMMKRAGVGMIIDDEFCRDAEPADKVFEDRSTPDGLAYILFTSGTTGHPKGVRIENHSVVNYAEAFEAEFHSEPGDVMLQYSVCSFDIFVEEVFTTLLNGVTLAIPPASNDAGEINSLMEFVDRHKVTIISGFPYLLAKINKLETIPPTLRLLISGGDILRHTYIDRLCDRNIMIYNTYGPSETTVCATYYRCDNVEPLEDGTYPIGKAIKGVKVKILDDFGFEPKKGEVGEICIYGEGVAEGYIGNPPEQCNFIRLHSGKYMYRSGDMGFVRPDGNLVFLHRRDKQVMILGKRVEPEEVENILNSSPDVDKGIVRAFNDDCGLAYLVAYFVPSHPDFSLHDIKEHLRNDLSDFMIPEFFVEVKDIPVNARGKVDMNALPIVLKDNEIND